MEVVKIGAFLERVRKPKKNIPLRRQLAVTAGIMLFGFALGVLQKWMDGTAANAFPPIIQRLDVGNYFGRLAIWILLGTIISVYAESPLRAGINTFFFFISMLAGYYLYCNYVLGFLPKAYMMIWIAAAFVLFPMACVCWYAKGEGMVAVIISGVIIGALLAQAINLVQGFYVFHFLEVLTWMAGIILLRRRLKEFVIEMGLSVAVAFAYQLIMPHWG